MRVTPIARRREVLRLSSKCRILSSVFMEIDNVDNELVAKTSIFYIDGFNWYHSIFRLHPEWKWLNLQTFFEKLRPHDNVSEVKLFSALHSDLDARSRQEIYFNALRTLPKVKIILGVFQNRTVSCRASCRKTYSVPEEKKTDVNLAVEMIADAVSERYEKMYVVSGDSDMQPPVEWIARNRPHIKLTVYVPAVSCEQGNRRTDYFKTKRLNVHCSFLPLDTLANHQLPNSINLGGGKFACRPPSWKDSRLSIV